MRRAELHPGPEDAPGAAPQLQMGSPTILQPLTIMRELPRYKLFQDNVHSDQYLTSNSAGEPGHHRDQPEQQELRAELEPAPEKVSSPKDVPSLAEQTLIDDPTCAKSSKLPHPDLAGGTLDPAPQITPQSEENQKKNPPNPPNSHNPPAEISQQPPQNQAGGTLDPAPPIPRKLPKKNPTIIAHKLEDTPLIENPPKIPRKLPHSPPKLSTPKRKFCQDLENPSPRKIPRIYKQRKITTPPRNCHSLNPPNLQKPRRTHNPNLARTSLSKLDNNYP